MTETITILIVEDEETTMRSLLIALKYGGFEVVTAHTGSEALKVVKERAKNKEPLDFIVYDINLPDMTGVELIETLCREGLELPSLAITGFASREVTLALRDAGREILEKPFQREQLYERIRMVLASQDSD